MAHFAKLDDDNKVIAIHVVDNSILLVNGEESEQAGIDFLTQLHGHDKWKQTSYNGSFRKNYAFIGGIYDVSFDGFIPPKPFPSWKLNVETLNWEAPVPLPTDGEQTWFWSELAQQWVNNQ